MYNIKVARGNVVNAAVEAIVTPANNNLTPGQGISKMVFYSAGKKLVEACSKLKYCETGSAIATSGYNLTAPYIIHAVGPFWHGGYVNEAEQLASVYISIMRIVRKLNIKSVAIPAICTGIAGYPLEESVDIAISSIVSYLQSHNMDTEVWFMCYDIDTLHAYRSRLNEGVSDITKYFNRKEISINAKMNDKENKLVKKRLFKKTITPEAEKEAVQSVLKRVIKKKYPNCTILLSRKNENISMKTVDKYQKSGPFITADSLKEYKYENGRMKMTLVPFCFIDTPQELEAKEIIDANANNINDHFEKKLATSYEERQQLNVVNVESLLENQKYNVKINVISTSETNSNQQTSNFTDFLPINDISNVDPTEGMSESEKMDYLYDKTVAPDEHFDDTILTTATDEPDILFNDDENYGDPSLIVSTTAVEKRKRQRHRHKSKYWPDFKPDYTSREYQKKIHWNR